MLLKFYIRVNLEHKSYTTTIIPDLHLKFTNNINNIYVQVPILNIHFSLIICNIIIYIIVYNN